MPNRRRHLRRQRVHQTGARRRGRVESAAIGGGVDSRRPEPWQEPAIAQHAERIFFDTLRAIAGETQPARIQIFTSRIQRVLNLTVGGHV